MARPNDEVAALLQEYPDLTSITGGEQFMAVDVAEEIVAALSAVTGCTRARARVRCAGWGRGAAVLHRVEGAQHPYRPFLSGSSPISRRRIA